MQVNYYVPQRALCSLCFFWTIHNHKNFNKNEGVNSDDK